MTITLIVLLIITLLAMVFLPFSRALMKDRAELHENPLEKKFVILISRINELMMNGQGEVVTFKNDPRMLNLFDDNHANMLIHFYYSTGSLTITLKYKYYHVELVKKMQFDNMRQAETFRQQDVANHFCEEAIMAIQEHQIKVGTERGMKDSTGDYMFSSIKSQSDAENPVNLVRGMYDSFTHNQKLAFVNFAEMIFTADGSSVESFKAHPHFSDLLLNFQVNYAEAKSQVEEIGASGLVGLFKASERQSLITMILPLLPFTTDSTGPNEERIGKFYSIFESLGYTQKTIDDEIQKMMLLSEHFGIS